MKWDVKIALYLFLAYALYGVSYLFSNGDYVVPLPMLFYFVPIVSLVFLFTSGFNRYTVFFLLLPLSVMSDKISEYSIVVSDILALVSIISWVVLGLVMLTDKSYREQAKTFKLLYAFPAVCLSALLFLLNDSILSISTFFSIGIVSGILIREEGEKYNLTIAQRRLFILASFISWMYLITTLSVYLA